MPDEFPIPQYEHLPTGSLQHRIRSLSEPALRQVLDYEQAHNNRPQVVEMVRRRLDELERGAQPAPGTQQDDPVEAQDSGKGSPVSPDSATEPLHPPRHGVRGLSGNPKGKPQV